MHLGYTILYVPEVEAAVRFYEAAFGLARRFVHPSGYGELETGGTTLAFASVDLARSNGVRFDDPRGDHPAAPPFELGFVVDDVAAALDQAVAAGAALVVGPRQKPWGQTVAFVRDPHGFLVELCTPVQP